jgi:hypothetical protein
MLAIAKKKAKAAEIDCQLLLGDMRTSRLGVFDSVITIFNAIGHLTKNDFRSQKTVVGTQEERNRREKK